jgi:hypothetical protein
VCSCVLIVEIVTDAVEGELGDMSSWQGRNRTGMEGDVYIVGTHIHDVEFDYSNHCSIVFNRGYNCYNCFHCVLGSRLHGGGDIGGPDANQCGAWDTQFADVRSAELV